MNYLIESINNLKQIDIQYIKERYPKRYLKASNYKSKEDFKRCILGYVLLIKLLGDFLEEDVYYNEFNKPFIVDKPYFNISHSGDYVAVVIDNNPVGIDIQKMEEKNLKLSKCFSKEEQEYINEKDSINRFHEIWSIKESAIKAIGTGLTTPFRNVEIIDATNLKVNDQLFIYKKGIVFDNYSLSICYKK